MRSRSEPSARRRRPRVGGYHEVRSRARRVLPRAVFDYIDGGSDGELTMARNRGDLDGIDLLPRNGEWVADPGLSTTVLGTRVAAPVLIAPCGGLRLVHPEGDLGVARAARQLGIIQVVSSASGHSLETVAEVGGARWFQLYRFSNATSMMRLVERADEAGYQALVVTVDTPVAANRERDARNGFSYDMRVNLSNALRLGPQLVVRPGWCWRYLLDGLPFELPNTADLRRDGRPLLLGEMSRPGAESHSASWDEIAEIRRRWVGPLVIKGVITPHDARRAVNVGADAVVVSNHGGRQLDGQPSSISALPAVVDALRGRAEVLLDSGIRRAADVVRARSLGARAVLLGRLPAFGLATGGGAGVADALSDLIGQLRTIMQLLGCPDVEDLDEGWVDARGLVRRGSMPEGEGN